MKMKTNTSVKCACAIKSVAYLTAVTLFSGNFAEAGDLYWDGTSGTWNSAAGWSTSSSSTTPDPASPPSSADVAFFNISGVTGAQSLSLDANQAASKLKILGSASVGTTLLGGGTDRTLSLGTGGIDILGGAGPVVIGSKLAGQGVPVALTGAQTWTNGCSNPMTFNNTISGSGLLTLRGAGGFRLNGSNTLSGGIITAGAAPTVYFGSDNALGSGTFTSGGGTFVVEDFPVLLTNKIKINNSASQWAGDGPLTLAGSATSPALTISEYANPPLYVNRTAPLLISGNWSLKDATSGLNNSGVGPTLSSGANVVITGDIRENNAGNASGSGNNGFNLYFNGTGSDLAIYGNNLYGAGAANSTKVTVNAKAGYNSLSIGGPGGEGAVVTPLGVAALYTNSGRGVFLKALINGQCITNNIKMDGSTNNDGGMPIGFDGENELTLGGVFSVGAGVNFPNLADATLTLAGGVNSGANTLTFQGPGDTEFTSTSLITGTTGGIGKTGPGLLVISGTNTTGKMAFYGGAVVLDYSVANANRLGIITNNTAALTLGGVDLQLKGGSFAQVLGANSGTTLTSGQSWVRRTDGGSSTVALGPIARATNSGSVIDFESGVASTTTANSFGILGGYGFATVGGADWAVGAGTITALSTYNSFTTPGTDKNILVTNSASVAGSTINTLKIAPMQSGEALTISSGDMIVSRSGFLFVGPYDYTVTGATIRGRTDYQGDLIVHQNGSGVLTIASTVGNGNNSALVKAGEGMLVLANTNNTYTGTTFILDGVLSVSAAKSFGTGTLTLNGGTLRTTAGFTTAKAVSLGSNGGTFEVVTNTLELSGIISSGYGALNKIGAGTLLLSGNNTYSGPTTVSEGTLKLGHYQGLGSASTNSNRAVSPVYVRNGAVLDIAGKNAYIGNFTLVDGTVADSAGGGLLGAYSFTMNKGTVNAALADVKVPNTGNTFNSINLFKRTADTVTLTATNTYSGTTFVEAGTLRVNGSLASSVIVETNGTLCGTGTLTRTVNVEGGVLAPGADGSGTGSIKLGRHLRIDADGALKVGIGTSGSGGVVMTHPQARALLEDAVLDLSLLSGGVPVLAAGVTLIDNQGSEPIEGTFADLPESSTFDVGNGRFASITYAGGDGNDVVITLQNRASVIVVR